MFLHIDYQIFLNWLRVRFGSILCNLGFKVQIFSSKWIFNLKYVWESVESGYCLNGRYLVPYLFQALSTLTRLNEIVTKEYIWESMLKLLLQFFSMFTNLFLPQQINLNKHSIVLHFFLIGMMIDVSRLCTYNGLALMLIT